MKDIIGEEITSILKKEIPIVFPYVTARDYYQTIYYCI